MYSNLSVNQTTINRLYKLEKKQVVDKLVRILG